MSYFNHTPVKKWKITDAFKIYCDIESRDNQIVQRSVVLQKMRNDLKILAKSTEASKAAVAARWIADWDVLKKKVQDRSTNNPSADAGPSINIGILQMGDHNTVSLVAGYVIDTHIYL